MLRTRVLAAIALLIPVGLVWWRGGLAWLAAVTVVSLLATWELFRAFSQYGFQPLYKAGLLAAVAIPVAAYADASLSSVAPAVALVALLSLLAIARRQNLDGALTDWALTVTGSLYVAVLLGYFVVLRQHQHGREWIAVALVCTWICDGAAYFAGNWFGQHPFAPRLSPRKTWEGTVGGLIAGTLSGLIAVPLLQVPPVLALLVGFAVAVIAVAGDLAESFIKRQVRLKDSSSLIPGHGGMLDRIDSLLVTVPLVYYLSAWVVPA